MESTKKKHPKKVLHASLSDKLQPMLHDIKESFVVNEKKLEKLVKKAASFIADHLHIGDKKKGKSKKKKNSGKKAVAELKTAVAKKVSPAKKQPAKKEAPKKAATKTAAPKKGAAKKTAKKK